MSVIKNNIYKFLSSLSLTIFLLCFIAFGSIFGTVIKQKADVEEYLSIYSDTTYTIIKYLGFDDVYHSPWFIAAIVLFAINLTLCTYGRFARLIKTEGKVDLPDESELSDMSMVFHVGNNERENTIASIKKGYQTIYEGEEGVVLQKGVISRYGVYIIHGSILIILIGSLIGMLFGYKGFMTLRKGETKDQLILRGTPLKEVPLGFSLKCKDFQVSFYPGGEPKDYVSKVEVLDNGRVVMERDIRVNSPLSYKGINVYQASYGASPSFLFTIAGEHVTLSERETYEKDGLVMMIARSESAIHNFGPGVLVAYLDQGEPKAVWFLKDVERLKEQKIQGVNIKLEDIKEDFYTGLEIAKDPGVWVVWTGFALILFGLYANFFVYYRRIYMRNIPDGLIVAGIAFKNREGFKEEFEKLKRKVSGNGS
ncbi:MAG: cytochrome c biogenesis protein ResB [Proteobacteria bacterium]|nr:cytochrome c biogenesis protein ResB [Pseudomonadota bacterium]